MKNVFFTIILAFIFSINILCQVSSLEYGNINDLEGVKKIFVHTDAGLEVRQNIIKHINEKLPNIEITSRAEDAEVILLLSADVQTLLAGYNHNSTTQVTGNAQVYGNQGAYQGQANTQTTSTPIYRSVINAAGIVFKVTPENRTRIIMDFQDSKKTIFERRPSTNFAKAFVKAYEQANGLKKK